MKHHTGIIARVLCILMILTMLPLNAFAGTESSAVRVSFIVPQDVTVRVSPAGDHGSIAVPEQNGTFLLPLGSYIYTASLDGRVTDEGTFSVTGEYEDLTILLPAEGSSLPGSTAIQPNVSNASVPGFDSEVCQENALAILQAYDADGYYVVNYCLSHGTSFFTAFLTSYRSNVEALDTLVHEYYHVYSYSKTSGNKEAIFLGNKSDLVVDMNHSGVTVFPTSTWAETLPSSLRTDRFSTYVSEGSTASANLDGPYGLINEYTAYCWGMHDQLEMFPYYKAQGNTFDIWSAFLNQCGNDRQAYAEFRFYILGYLNYAKTNDRTVYDHFLNNQNFLDAYLSIKYRFEAQIDEFENRCSDIVSLCKKAGVSASIDGDIFWIGSRGISLHLTQYEKLMTELAKSKYQTVEQAIIDKGTVSAYPEAPQNLAVSDAPSGVAVSWNEVSGATKYKVYRKEDGGSWSAVKTLTATSWTDTSALMGKTYSYRVTAYNGLQWSDYSSTKKILFNPFTDVASEGAAFKYISWAYNNGIVKGTGDGSTFTPDGNCSRLQFVMMLWKMHGSPEVSGTNPFTDVTGAKATKAILWALKKKIIVAGDTFDPDGNITRLQIVMILWKMAGSPKAGGENTFTDVTGAKAIKAVLWAKEKGITKGTSETTFSPDNACTRQQLVTFLYKYNQTYKVIK